MPFVAVDTVGAGDGELVLVAQGSAAREAIRVVGPIDAAIVAILDSLTVGGKRTYTRRRPLNQRRAGHPESRCATVRTSWVGRTFRGLHLLAPSGVWLRQAMPDPTHFRGLAPPGGA